MFELIQQSMINNHSNIPSKVLNYIHEQKEPYNLTLTEYNRIKTLVQYENLSYRILIAINLLIDDTQKIIMDEELFCVYIRREAERNATEIDLTLDYNLKMFNFIYFYAFTYKMDLESLANMVIPEYVKYVDHIYKDHPPLIFPFSNPPL